MKIFTSTNRLAFRKGSIKSTAIFMLLFSFIALANKAEAQSLYVTTGGTVLAQNTAVNIAGNAIVTTGATPLVGATVSVSSNFVTGQDVLGLNGAASGGISSSYNATTGVLTLSGSASAADYQATLQKVTYTNTSATPNTSVRVITFSLNAALPFSGTGHFYEFVTIPGISWPDANTAANARQYFGLQGYLVTVMSAEENAFCAAKLVGDGWMGANAVSDGVTWIWATGPEAGTVFWNGVNYGTGVSGKYANWAVNQPDASAPHSEDYVQFYSSGGFGKWNNLPFDYDPLINGYVIEYGGMAGDPVIHISDFVTVDFAPKVSSLATTTGSAIKWYDAPTGGNLLSSTALLVSGNHYYASQTVNGCESTSRLDVVAALNLAAPVASAHTASTTQIVWNWSAVSGATGYKWGTTNVYASATDIPSGTSKTETGLTCNTSYTRYVWAYNATASCVSRPVLLTQTTSSCVAAPSVTTIAVSNIGATTATFNGNITAVNGANATVRGFKYSTTNGFDPATTGTNISEAGSFSTGPFSLSPSGLATTTTYYVRAYATNTAGTTYGDQVSFITAIQTEFSYTGGTQTFTVPAGITSVTLEVWGAEGGVSGSPSNGGLGGYAIGTLAVSAGSTLYLYVGGQGQSGGASDQTNAGGWNGGGNGGYDNSDQVQNGGGGGGASDVRYSGQVLGNRVIVAGGGGGSANSAGGGNGGGTSGSAGTTNSTGIGGGGGTQSAGGTVYTTSWGASAGSLGQGGNGSTNQNAWGSSGGGGGYYGGGGGTGTAIHSSGYAGAGGGGSSYIGGVTSGSTTAGQRSGNGLIKITY